MKYLKKVSVSDLDSNTGTIIDSMNPGDDQTVNAPSIHAVKELTGVLNDLSTIDKDNIVDAINEVNNKIYNFKKQYFTDESIDLNNVTDSGLYMYDVDCTITNRPSSKTGNADYLIVLKTFFDSTLIQFFITGSTTRLDYRIKVWNTWTAWKQISTS